MWVWIVLMLGDNIWLVRLYQAMASQLFQYQYNQDQIIAHQIHKTTSVIYYLIICISYNYNGNLDVLHISESPSPCNT